MYNIRTVYFSGNDSNEKIKSVPYFSRVFYCTNVMSSERHKDKQEVSEDASLNNVEIKPTHQAEMFLYIYSTLLLFWLAQGRNYNK